MYATAIRAVVDATAVQLVDILLDGLLEGADDTSSNVLTVLRLLSVQFPRQLAAGVPPALERLSTKVASAAEKVEFLGKFNK
jgi:hypothetical protein